MSTTANIDFFGFEVCTGSDGGPDDMIPELADLRSQVLELEAETSLDYREAAIVVLFRRGTFNVAYAHMPLGSYDHAYHTYEVDEEAVDEVSTDGEG